MCLIKTFILLIVQKNDDSYLFNLSFVDAAKFPKRKLQLALIYSTIESIFSTVDRYKWDKWDEEHIGMLYSIYVS